MARITKKQGKTTARVRAKVKAAPPLYRKDGKIDGRSKAAKAAKARREARKRSAA